MTKNIKRDMDIGMNIAEERNSRKLSQDDVAKILDIDPQKYGRIERGKTGIINEAVFKFIEHFELDANELLFNRKQKVDFSKVVTESKDFVDEINFHESKEIGLKCAPKESSLICIPKNARYFRIIREKFSRFFKKYENRLKKLHSIGSVLIRIIHLVAILLLFMLVLALGASGGLATPSVCPAVYILLLAAFVFLLGSCTLQYQRMR